MITNVFLWMMLVALSFSLLLKLKKSDAIGGCAMTVYLALCILAMHEQRIF